MGVVLLPQRFLAQPQYSPPIADEYRDAQLLSLFSSGSSKNLAGANDLIAGAGGYPTRILNRQGYALKFNPGDLITEQSIVIPSVLPGLTVFAWVRPSVLNESYRRIAETSYVDGFYLGSDNLGGNYLFTTNGASLSACVGGQQVVGQRDFVCGTWDGTNRLLYVNGVQVASSTSTKPSVNRKMTVGSNASGGESWLGDIDTVGVFFRAFPASEVWSLYQQPWKLVKATPRRIFVTTTSGASVALTGQSATASQGALSPATSVALSGQALTASQGTLTPSASEDRTAELSGQSVALSQGTLTPSVSGEPVTVALIGQSIIAAQGALSTDSDSGETGGHFGGSHYPARRRNYKDCDREDIRRLLTQLDEVQEEVVDAPQEVKEQVAAIASHAVEQSLDLSALQQDLTKVRQLLAMWQQQVQKQALQNQIMQQQAEDEELLLMLF